ncbi:NAD-dependent epimerase/dehydratase family protein [bacterium]|nr:NAD-dependent epimerase/dehydratase family protein [bacterium]
MDLRDCRFLVTGGGGFLGGYVCRNLESLGIARNQIFVPRSSEYDLRSLDACMRAIEPNDVIIHLAAKVGGLWAHVNRQADFFYDNAMMSLNMVHAAHVRKARKIVNLGTVCEYPDLAPIPFKEDDLWAGYPSAITAPYGMGKKMSLVAGNAYRAQFGLRAIHLLLINLYGPGDDFNPETSHVIPALIRRVKEAIHNESSTISVWGDGSASREFLFVEDAAEAIVLATLNYDDEKPVNLGSGVETKISDITYMICKAMGYTGTIKWDENRSGGQSRRRLDVSLAEASFGFKAATGLDDGLKKTINWYLSEVDRG